MATRRKHSSGKPRARPRPPGPTDAVRFRRNFTLGLAVAISLLFLFMIRGMLSAVLFAAIMAALSQPLYRRLLRGTRNRRAPAAGLTMLLVVLLVLVPFLGLVGVVTAQAVDVTQNIAGAVQKLLDEPGLVSDWQARFPALSRLEPYRETIITKAGELAGRTGTFLVNSLAAATRGTAVFLFGLFVMLYAMFFFLLDGKRMLSRIQDCLPIPNEESGRMLDLFVSVTRATLKGTLIIGIVQGALAGLALGVAGIRGAVFWGTVMAVLSVIPGVGTALVWVPAVIYLGAVGRVGAAIGVTVWCAAIVGSADNLLRPRLVGRDTKMSDLLIMLSTLGGLSLFGAAGIVIGPLIAALFVTVWEIYRTAFGDYLSEAHANEA